MAIEKRLDCRTGGLSEGPRRKGGRQETAVREPAGQAWSPSSGITSSDASRDSCRFERMSIRTARAALTTAIRKNPAPAADPIAPTDQTPAAVVSPRTLPRDCRMDPAPRNPIPAATPWMMRPGSDAGPWICTEARTKLAAPRATIMWVRRPAGLCLDWRCQPTKPPSNAAVARRATIVSSATSCTGSLPPDVRNRRNSGLHADVPHENDALSIWTRSAVGSSPCSAGRGPAMPSSLWDALRR